MSIENPFLNQRHAAEQFKPRPEIEMSKKYLARKDKRKSILERILGVKLNGKELMKSLKTIISRRLKKQADLREPHQKTDVDLEKEYTSRYGLIQDGDYESTEERRTLYGQMAREAVYYEMNPSAKWTETDGEAQEREYARGAVMHTYLQPAGLSDLTLTGGNLDSDQGELEAVYQGAPEKLVVFDKEAAVKALDILFSLQTKVDRHAAIEDMKRRFGCQEVIFILEDIYDSWEGYKDNTNGILEDWENADEEIDNFKQKAAQLVEKARPIYERYQKWDELYLVNNDLNLDNLSKNALPINWQRVGVTNNFLSVLINDYGSLRLSAWESGQTEFVKALDDEVLLRFKDMGDEEAGQTVIRLATLRSFSDKAKGVNEDEVELKERLKQELLKAIE